MIERRVAKAIDDALIARGSEPPVRDYIRISGLGYCGRQLSYSILGYEESEATPDSQMAMIQGYWVEDGLASLLGTTDFEVHSRDMELDWYEDDKLIARGHIDGLIDTAIGTHLWECKGMSAYRYGRLIGEPGLDVVRKTNPDYYIQTQGYMTLLNTVYDMDVPSCIFTVIPKDPSAANMLNRKLAPVPPRYVEEIPWNEQFGRTVLGRAKDLYETVIEGRELWPREREPARQGFVDGKRKQIGDWDCSERFCNFFAECNPKEDWPYEMPYRLV